MNVTSCVTLNKELSHNTTRDFHDFEAMVGRIDPNQDKAKKYFIKTTATMIVHTRYKQ